MPNTITHCPHESYNNSNAKFSHAELLHGRLSFTVSGLRLCSQAEDSSVHQDIINLRQVQQVLGYGKKVMSILKDGATKVVDSGNQIPFKT